MRKRKLIFYFFLLLFALPTLFSACQEDTLSFKEMADGASFQTEWIPCITLADGEGISELASHDQLIYVNPGILRNAPSLEGYYLYSSSDDRLYKIVNQELQELASENVSLVKLKGIIHVASGAFTSHAMVDPYIKLEIESVNVKK